MTLTHHHIPARSGQTRSLVVLLHGFGSNGQAMLGLGKSLSMALPETTFLSPDAPDAAQGRHGWRMWYTIPELGGSSAEEADLRLQASAHQLDDFVDDQLAAHGLPAAAMALLGFSQGAGMAYEVDPRRRDQLAGAVAIAGRIKRKSARASGRSGQRRRCRQAVGHVYRWASPPKPCRDRTRSPAIRSA